MFNIPVMLIFIKCLIDGQETPEGCELFYGPLLIKRGLSLQSGTTFNHSHLGPGAAAISDFDKVKEG